MDDLEEILNSGLLVSVGESPEPEPTPEEMRLTFPTEISRINGDVGVDFQTTLPPMWVLTFHEIFSEFSKNTPVSLLRPLEVAFDILEGRLSPHEDFNLELTPHEDFREVYRDLLIHIVKNSPILREEADLEYLAGKLAGENVNLKRAFRIKSFSEPPPHVGYFQYLLSLFKNDQRVSKKEILPIERPITHTTLQDLRRRRYKIKDEEERLRAFLAFFFTEMPTN